MLLIFGPFSAARLCAYHAEAFSNARENDPTTGERRRGRWHGELAHRWGLVGEVGEEHFRRLAEGRDPCTDELLVRPRPPHAYVNRRGATVNTMAHRAGWDATFRSPKSVSITALVGGDERVLVAHRESVAVSLEELQQFVQARLRGNPPTETTRNWAAATFEHDRARPADGYAAPHLHTHVLFFNMTQTRAGRIRSLEPRELFLAQRYTTAVYRSELAHRLAALGYEVECGASRQPEIRGYSIEYLKASSARGRQIVEAFARRRRQGPASIDIAAICRRERKVACSPDEMLRQHRELAAAFGDQPLQVVDAAHRRVSRLAHVELDHPTEPGGRADLTDFTHRARAMAKAALTFAIDRNLARHASVDERALLGDALTRAMGEATLREVRAEFERRLQTGELISVPRRARAPARALTSAEMVTLERETIGLMRGGQRTLPGHSHSLWELQERHPDIGERERAAVSRILGSRDRIMALECETGPEKSGMLAALRYEAERAGYQVEGGRRTSPAARALEEARALVARFQQDQPHGSDLPVGVGRFYVVDEWSVDNARRMHEFLRGLDRHDRVVLVASPRHHESFEGGRPYLRLLGAGMQVVRRDVIEEAVTRTLQLSPEPKPSHARHVGLQHALGIDA